MSPRWCSLSAVGVALVLLLMRPVAQSQASSPGELQEVQLPATGLSVGQVFEFDKGIVVGVQAKLGRELNCGSNSSFRVGYMSATVSVHNVQLGRKEAFGEWVSDQADPVDLTVRNLDAGMAPLMAARILGLEGSHPYLKAPVGPFVVTVQPATGKTWGGVRSEVDLTVKVALDPVDDSKK